MRPRNLVLSALSDEAYDRLRPQLEPVTLEAGDMLYASGTVPKSVYFLDSGVAALSVRTQDGTEIELSIVGNESTIGERAVFDYDFFIIECSMLTNGEGHRIDPETFGKEFYLCNELHDSVLNGLEAQITEASQTSLCNQSHSIHQRLARWILTLADRSGSESFDITHEAIRKSLGVTRSSITRTAVDLKEKGMIDYARGAITIIDRYDLERESCECYEVILKALNAYHQAKRRKA